jgi:hypothetical protein
MAKEEIMKIKGYEPEYGMPQNEFELGFLEVDGPPRAWFECREPRSDGPGMIYRYVYQTLMVGGVKPEGNLIELWYTQTKPLIEAFLVSLDEWLPAYVPDMTIVWRQRPELIKEPVVFGNAEPYLKSRDLLQIYCRIALVPTAHLDHILEE